MAGAFCFALFLLIFVGLLVWLTRMAAGRVVVGMLVGLPALFSLGYVDSGMLCEGIRFMVGFVVLCRESIVWISSVARALRHSCFLLCLSDRFDSGALVHCSVRFFFMRPAPAGFSWGGRGGAIRLKYGNRIR